MPSGPTYHCWHCYGANSKPHGPCVECRRPIEQPADITYVDQLLWALGHPIAGTQMIAAQILGERGELAAEQPLRVLVRGADPYLAAQALQSLVSIVGVTATRDLLEPLARSGAPAVQRVALRALHGSG